MLTVVLSASRGEGGTRAGFRGWEETKGGKRVERTKISVRLNLGPLCKSL